MKDSPWILANFPKNCFVATLILPLYSVKNICDHNYENYGCLTGSDGPGCTDIVALLSFLLILLTHYLIPLMALLILV